MLQLEKEITFVWDRPWSAMSYIYLVVRYFGIVVAMYVGWLYPPDSTLYVDADV
ncbi:uncharacterized protein BJ212DRAFT_1412931 [Suillus subaureus]|uniref:DUF6533 domain-containing protein n=1 Tax=Suillus subaureus TaxID=48587 RepID=A0A9P7DHA3_9AGAM|nr:uncharacterized protein BJ212DRAFT_1412931 [Suillus subaureus]KAG1794308.1 hypothetical protein BJ212DRAFT_1412931 [Suillus subaureus]